MGRVKNIGWHIAVTAAVAVAAVVIYRLHIPCVFREVTGIRCPACGISHAALAVLRLDFAAAWRHNPLIFLFPPALWLFFTDGKPTRHQTLNRALLYAMPAAVAVWYAVRLLCGI